MTREKVAELLVFLWTALLVFEVAIWYSPLTFEPFEINYGVVSVLIVAPSMIEWIEKRRMKSAICTVVLLVLAGLGTIVCSKFLGWGNDWKTQTIIYRSQSMSNHTVEFQLQDAGSFGYNRRHVDRLKLLPFLEWTKEIDMEKVDSSGWRKVDEHLNEMNLKGG